MSIKGMLEGRSKGFKQRFLVTHFFNPVRYMRLLELVAGEDTSPEVLAAMATFGEEVLGKGIVYGKDTTNFIANRIGTYGMLRTIALMQEKGLKIEEVDKIFGPPMGRPKSAIFRTADLVGLDTLMHVAKNCYDNLAQDEARDTFKPPAFLQKMLDKGMLGDKSGGGFYKKEKGDGGKEILALDLNTLEYRKQEKVRFESRPRRASRRCSPARTRPRSSQKRPRWTRWPTPPAAWARLPTTSSTSTGPCAGATPGRSVPSSPGTRLAWRRAWSA
jgi:3-hydroxyacyl-CoA dehydrogenase